MLVEPARPLNIEPVCQCPLPPSVIPRYLPNFGGHICGGGARRCGDRDALFHVKHRHGWIRPSLGPEAMSWLVSPTGETSSAAPTRGSHREQTTDQNWSASANASLPGRFCLHRRSGRAPVSANSEPATLARSSMPTSHCRRHVSRETSRTIDQPRRAPKAYGTRRPRVRNPVSAVNRPDHRAGKSATAGQVASYGWMRVLRINRRSMPTTAKTDALCIA